MSGRRCFAIRTAFLKFDIDKTPLNPALRRPSFRISNAILPGGVDAASRNICPIVYKFIIIYLFYYN